MILFASFPSVCNPHRKTIMNCSIRALSKSLLARSTPTTLPCLSFLYQTQTIIQPWMKHSSQSRQPQRRRFATKQKETGKPRRQGKQKLSRRLTDRSAKASADGQKTESKPKPKARKDVEQSEDQPTNAFTDILRDQDSKSKTDQQSPYGRRVTMTQAEEEIFDRLQNMTSKTQPIQDKTESSDLFGGISAGKNLADAFDNIADTLDKQDRTKIEIEAKEEQERIARVLQEKQSAKAKAKGILLQSLQLQDVAPPSSSQPQLSQPGSDTAAIKKMDQDRISQREELRGLFSNVENDTDLWKLLEEHMFKDMRNLNEILNIKQKQLSKATHKVAKKKRKGKDPSVDMAHLSELELNREQELLAKVKNTYGPALLFAARLFRTGFPRSPYAMLLLPMIKNLGPMSYVLAGSTSLYDELLYIRWKYYRDLNGCTDLVEEMISHNILADQRTAVVYEMICRIREKEIDTGRKEQTHYTKWEIKEEPNVTEPDKAQKSSSLVPVGSPVKSFLAGWWQLQGIEAGWVRWTKAYDRLIAMTRLEMQRKEDEQRLVEQETRLLAEDNISQNTETSHSFGETQERMIGDLEPEIEILSSEDLSELENLSEPEDSPELDDLSELDNYPDPEIATAG